MAKKNPLPAHGAGPVTKEMTLDFEGLLRLLANSLYSEKKVFMRELVQNGHDSIRRREKREPNHRGRLDIETRPEEGWISFTDNGIGMNAADLHDYLSRIGASGTKLLGRGQEQVSGLVGQFGIGFLSGFIVAERVEVRTRKFDEDTGWLWRNGGGKQYTVEPCKVRSAGTTVKVIIKDPADRVLIETDSVNQVIREYCDMLRVPIHVNSGVAAVNTQIMPWERDGLSDEERDIDCKIYLAKTIRGDSLIETFPVRLGSPLKAGGILYISKMRSFGVRVPRNLRIYQDRMFVVNDAELLPPWAEFVSGIIETSGLTPNAARDGFIKNKAWSQLRDALGDLIIRGMEKLREANRKQLSYILKYHDLGIKAACHHHGPFFQKFAHLLEWRVNRLPNAETKEDAEDMMDFDIRAGGVSYHWRTLPEVLETTRSEEGRPKRLRTFTTSNAANQYFEMANAEGVLVVDASYPFEDDLIAAYAKLPDAPSIELVYVDRQGGGFFKDLQNGDQVVRRLADIMGRGISPGGSGKLKVEARRFAPTTLPAVLLNAERGKAEQQARQLLQDPTSPGNLREMAEELLRNARAANAMRMVINAACPFIQELARQDSNDPDVRHVMLGVYNSAILYNAEMLTPRTAKVFHDQFGDFMEANLEMIKARAFMRQERESLEQERQVLRRAAGQEEPAASHRIIFLMTPFNEDYAGLEKALRVVIEERWGCQLCLARDRVLNPELRGNVEAHMRQAHAFLAEVSEGNPNVMYEVGRARALYPQRPMIFLSHPSEETGKVTLPVDLAGLIRLDYNRGSPTAELADHLAKELRRMNEITNLLDDSGMDDYIPYAKLKSLNLPYKLPDLTYEALATRFGTSTAWKEAKTEAVHQIVQQHDLDVEDAASLLRKIQRGITKS
jgi:molecular chaperone HtpG